MGGAGPSAGRAGPPHTGCWEPGGEPPLLRGEAAAERGKFLMIQCPYTTIFTDAKVSSMVFDLKCIVEGILSDCTRCGKDAARVWLHQPKCTATAPATALPTFWADDALEALHIPPPLGSPKTQEAVPMSKPGTEGTLPERQSPTSYSKRDVDVRVEKSVLVP
ncbi:hypothetical protein P7K49_014662 [Saguinus oedipus]|uniref:Uncharacterized protein n=1 Tax=Saguinus oedipus TaxID=9490 RepID=A0ABQ9V712_SAGOE|nr:hypothetical protein P7K49_014662 [Saguinus oedipus]